MATEKTETQGELLSKLAENEERLDDYMSDRSNLAMHERPLQMFAKTKLELLKGIQKAAIREKYGIKDAKAALDLELERTKRAAELDGLVKDIDSLQQVYWTTETTLRYNRDPTLVDGLQNKLRHTNANIAILRKFYDTAIHEIRAAAAARATSGAAARATSGAAARATSGAAARGGRRKYTTHIRKRGKKNRSKKYRSKKYKHRHV